MASFFKKALGIFVEFDESSQTSNQTAGNNSPVPQLSNTGNTPSPATSISTSISREELDKFEAHFDRLFEQSNMPGPDYFEFFKMMETLEAHIPDEKARISAVFASLSIQGMTKQRLIESAAHYRTLVEKDKAQFDAAVAQKMSSEIQARERGVSDLEKRIAAHSEMIQKLTKEITDFQLQIGKLKGEIAQEQVRINTNSGGYKVACDAMLNKLDTDVQKINATL